MIIILFGAIGLSFLLSIFLTLPLTLLYSFHPFGLILAAIFVWCIGDNGKG